MVKNPPANAGDARDTGSIPGSGRPSREGNGNSFQYSCLGNLMDKGAWQATDQEVTKNQRQLDPMNRSTPGLPVHHHLLEFTQTSIEPVMPSSHLTLCHPLLLLPPILPSIRVFSNESTLHMGWPKYWSFSFSIIPSKEIPGLISFRMHRLDLLAVQGTLKSLLQHHSSKASILRCSAFFTVQLSHPYVTAGKNICPKESDTTEQLN